MKHDISAEDQEDFEQERLIQEWLNKQKPTEQFEYKHVSRTGRARNTRIRASLSLDQKTFEDGTGTFADIIAGSDGRDLYGSGSPEPVEIIDAYLACLGFNEEDTEWVIKTLRWSINQSELLSKILASDSEWSIL